LIFDFFSESKVESQKIKKSLDVKIQVIKKSTYEKAHSLENPTSGIKKCMK